MTTKMVESWVSAITEVRCVGREREREGGRRGWGRVWQVRAPNVGSSTCLLGSQTLHSTPAHLIAPGYRLHPLHHTELRNYIIFIGHDVVITGAFFGGREAAIAGSAGSCEGSER